MSFWLVASKTVENIEVAKENLKWGFWDKKAGEKQRRNWRSFRRLYNKIKPFDVIIFQLTRSRAIHAIGVVKKTFYDDQTPVWPGEEKEILYPWRVALSSILFSKEPFTSHSVEIENYIDGYGLGELPEHEFRKVFEALKKKLGVEVNLG